MFDLAEVRDEHNSALRLACSLLLRCLPKRGQPRRRRRPGLPQAQHTTVRRGSLFLGRRGPLTARNRFGGGETAPAFSSSRPRAALRDRVVSDQRSGNPSGERPGRPPNARPVGSGPGGRPAARGGWTPDAPHGVLPAWRVLRPRRVPMRAVS